MQRFVSSDRGSIPAVLLTSIVVGGLAVVLLAATLINQRTARFDRSYTTVLQGADEFAQEAAHHVIRGDYDPTGTAPVGTVEKNFPGATCTAATDGDVCWTATKTSDLTWEVESTVAARTTGNEVVTRTVKLDVVDQPRFFLAAFADTQIRLNGGNGAASYGNGAWFTGNGLVGSNEDIRMNGASTGVDGVHLYNWDNYSDPGRCTHPGGNGCDDVLADPQVAPSARYGPRLQVGGDRLDTQFIDDALANCLTVTSPLPSYTSSTDGATLNGNTFPTCVDNLTFDTDVTIINGPVEVYVAGQFSVANGREINCPAGGCATGSGDPDSTNLIIYSDGGDVAIGNHSKIAAAVYAPESDCAGNPSNAQGTIFGSMICNTIDNNGGWQFNFDDDLLGLGSGIFELDDYREE